MNFLQFLKNRNNRTTKLFIETKKYWTKSPLSLILYLNIQNELEKHSKKDGKILDAGAGRLAYRSILKNYFKEYVSTDFTKTHSDLSVISDIEKLPFKKNEFDMVLCTEVLEHVPHPWIAINELYRVLKTDGIAIITVPHLAYLHNMPYDFYRYTEHGLRTLTNEVGFKNIEIRPIGGFFCFIGYIRSTLLIPLFSFPIIGNLIFLINYLFSLVDISIDRFSKNWKIFPLNYILIAKK